jgi:hypothetical protein
MHYRSDAMRSLARRAVDQGFQEIRLGSGHVRLVGPDGSAIVSSTSNGGARGVKNANAALVRAGFDPAWRKRTARRAARPPYAGDPAMTELEPQHAPPAPGKGVEHARYKTGRTMFVSDERGTVEDVELRIRRRADGALVGWTPPDSPTWAERKSWQVGPKGLTPEGQRTALEAKVRDWIAEGKPEKLRQPRVKLPDPSNVPEESASMPTNGHAASPAAESPASASTLDRQLVQIENDEPSSVSWLSVRIDRSEYPLASALAELVEKIAPAIQALEASGRKAAADLLVESVELSDVERELVSLWQEVNNRPRLEHGRRSDG